MSESEIRILIVDDYEIVRNSLIEMLTREPDMKIVGTAENGRQAVRLAQSTVPDVIIMDVAMPELDGIRAAGEIRALGITSHIIMLSMHDNEAIVQRARRNGAAHYILKQKANRDLIPAIRATGSGERSVLR